MINFSDGCHIEIHPNSDDATDYYNYKGWYSTNLLALVDYRYLHENAFLFLLPAIIKTYLFEFKIPLLVYQRRESRSL